MTYSSSSVRKTQVKGGKKTKTNARQGVGLLPNNGLTLVEDHPLGLIRTVKNLRPKTYNQVEYVKSLYNNQVTLCLAPAGCGKTLLALHTGIKLFNDDKDPTNHILYLRVVVDNQEERQIGYLDGSKDDKLAPYARPAVDNLKVFMSDSEANFLFKGRKASVDIPEFLEGRSLRNTFVIFDEAHASCRSTVNMVLERIGEGSRLALLGYPNQRKNAGKDPLESLFQVAEEEDWEDWGRVRMTQVDNLRNPNYRKWEAGLNRWLGR